MWTEKIYQLGNVFFFPSNSLILQLFNAVILLHSPLLNFSSFHSPSFHSPSFHSLSFQSPSYHSPSFHSPSFHSPSFLSLTFFHLIQYSHLNHSRNLNWKLTLPFLGEAARAALTSSSRQLVLSSRQHDSIQRRYYTPEQNILVYYLYLGRRSDVSSYS